MNALRRTGVIVVFLLVTGSALAQSGNRDMMNDSMWGYGWMGGDSGYWMPLLILVAVVALVVWVVRQQKK